MRFVSSCLVLFVAAFLASDRTFTGAEDTAKIDNAPAPDHDRVALTKAIRHLRRRHKAGGEDRMVVPPVAAYYYMLHSTPTTSTQSYNILHAVEDDIPLSKGAKAVIAVVSVGLAAGIVGTGVFKLMQILTNSADTRGSA
ncbi:hypothetical protein PHYPSEUDO_003936 [Phytophthora pseudosyringae]|uniref:RxLR effector protein n=1 Tax=Phytophthora pseudosyringae TaxID=221518 RepID=A0A8T1VPE4_9STRA|nr:hypothetical protein PHYPSEUDO_003936 [Phytophthora pseudosyringae]